MITTPTSDPVEAFVAATRSQGKPSAEQLQAVLDLLRVWLARRGLSDEDREEVSADAVLRLLRIVEAGKLDLDRPPGAWLRVVADNLARDRLRKVRRSAGLTLYDEAHVDIRDEDRLARFLDSTAASSDIRRAMRAAADAGEHEVVRVVASWLALAQAGGEAPSTRQVGERLGVSHMKVQRTLRKFGGRLSR
jgi:RNA polymerase sigma factor (sigma-70 family)